MLVINTEHLGKCIQTLQSSLLRLQKADAGSIDYEVFRNATIKGFELTLETSGKLLRRVLKEYKGSPRSIDELTYKDVIRHAAKHGLLSEEEVRRWFNYRDNRNNTAQDYGEGFAEMTLKLLPQFVQDANMLLSQLNRLMGLPDVVS